MMTLLRVRAARRIACAACPLIGSALDDIVEERPPLFPQLRYEMKWYVTPESPAGRENLWYDALAYWDEEIDYPIRMMADHKKGEEEEKNEWWDNYQRRTASATPELKIAKKRGRPKNNPG